MQLHLEEIAANVAAGAHAQLISAEPLAHHPDLTHLAALAAPELNPFQNAWQQLLRYGLSN